MNSIIYDVAFPDGTVKEYAANVIAENIYRSVDINGIEQLSLDCILDHHKGEKAIPKSDGYLITKKGKRRMRKITIGWKILVRWKNKLEQWVDLRLIKDNYLVQMAEYAMANKLTNEPAFYWWVPYTIKKERCYILVY